ncbi:MAG: bi-domain-containing oxidoreductase, partial [Gemmatimonadota bacterium]
VQLAAQLVRAQGCRCVGIDLDPERVALAERFGVIGVVAAVERDGTVVEAVRAHTDGVGADAVLMTLASDSDEPMRRAAEMSRKRGRIVLVGVTGLDLDRADFYEKELSFQVSCSYGPGRYDPTYERGGRDYPLPYVRWTEKRNLEAVLELMADGRLDPAPLISHRFPIDEAAQAYDLLVGEESTLGIVLTYPGTARERRERTIRLREQQEVAAGRPIAGVLGAGDFARRTLIPAIRKADVPIRTIASSGGLSAAVEGERAGAAFASSDVDAVLADPDVDTVFVLTRHDTHAGFALRALEADKHVFVEKPLALTRPALGEVRAGAEGSRALLMVGFNRRFAPLSTKLKRLVDRRSGPLSLVLTVNAGRLNDGHWVKDPGQGGGRIVGEACHFIDLARFLAGVPIADLGVRTAADGRGPIDDIAHLTLGFADGSTAAIHYLANGSSRYPKERVEAFFDGRTARIENWRRLRTWGLGRWDGLLPRRMDKGHRAEVAAFAAAVREGGPPPIPLEEILEVSEWSIRAAELARGGTATRAIADADGSAAEGRSA